MTDEGTVREVKSLQLAKQSSPNDVTEDGIIREVKQLQPEKHSRPNDVTEDGMVREVKPVHLWYLLLVDYQYYTL